MKLLALIGCTVFAALVMFNTPEDIVSAEQTVPVEQQLQVDTAVLPEVSAVAYEIFDVDTGEVLLAFNEQTALPIASVTKLFTAAQVLDNMSDEPLVITHADVATEGRSGKLEAGQEYTEHELLFPLLIESSNDAAEALARMVGEIPLAERVLDDASGLSAKNVASVSELAAEVRTLYNRLPHVFDVTTLEQYIGEYTGWVNNSPVIDLPGYKGGKHGYTHEANQTLIAIFEEESLGGRELGYVLLGSDSVRVDTEALRAFVQNSVWIE